MPSRSLRAWLLLPTLMALYVAGAKVGLEIGFVPQVSAVWPPTGIALASLILFGYGAWPAITFGALLVNLTTPDESVWTACFIAAGNTLEALLAAWLLQRFFGFRPQLDRVRDVLGLIIVGAILSTTEAATVGVVSLCLGQVHDWGSFGKLWAVWWLGDAVGDLIVAPVLLTCISSRGKICPWHRAVDAGALLMGLLILSVIVFGGSFEGAMSRYRLDYVVFPLVIWAALRFGPALTTLAMALISGVAIWGTLGGRFSFGTGLDRDNLVLLQAYLAVLAVTGLILAAAVAERRQASESSRRSEERLRESDQRKDQFLAMLAHELRNPLAPIRNAVEILRRARPDEASLAWARDLIERQVKHLARLTDDLLDVSRITRGKVRLLKEAVNTSNIVVRAVEANQPFIDARGHQLITTLPSEPLFIEADATRMAQVLGNLLNNAAKYTPSGGKIWLSVARDGSEAVFRVKDNGAGIRPEMLTRIFEIFVQGDSSLDRTQEGLGLGLTLVRNLVEMHRGTVTASSPGLGQGSEFIVRLPLCPASPSIVSIQRVPATAEAGTRRVLVVDDNRDAAESLAQLLKLKGHEVRAVFDGPSALDAARTYQPDVILLDIGLPRMDGYEVARRLRDQPECCKTCLVALTGYGREEDRRRSEQAGFDFHLVKPVEPAELHDMLVHSSPRKL
jgi:signal transduction histidine kinase/ActR/RegA family two-component response regulator